jgi:hypothetical protein
MGAVPVLSIDGKKIGYDQKICALINNKLFESDEL